MPSVAYEHELEAPDRFDPDNQDLRDAHVLKLTSPEGTEEIDSPDAACDLICDLVAEQFWDWWDNPGQSRRFKPRIKVYEVW
jgi:hypothetical protein